MGEMGLKVLNRSDNVGMRFALIGTPVGHSLSPAMHNAVYRSAKVDWSYEAIDCPSREEALHCIDLVRTGVYRGLNVTMPYKQLALAQADFSDPAAVVAGGANVLVREGYDLHAYNTDGAGAVRAIMRQADIDSVTGKRIAVCGTGPTALAIACSFAQLEPRQIIIFSRDVAKADAGIERLITSLPDETPQCFRSALYEDAWRLVPGLDIFVDATPLGMNPDDEAVIDTHLFHEDQVVFDVVYGHGLTKLLAGASARGALALDGTGMLVEQAALSIEIWQRELGYSFEIDRNLMRGPML